MHHLAMHFGIAVSCIHKFIHRIIPILHTYVVPTYIKWHRMNRWRHLAGYFPEWPRVVAIIDGTPFRISRPKGINIVKQSISIKVKMKPLQVLPHYTQS